MSSKKVQSREADATILGFEYQLISTADEIISKFNSGLSTNFTIEGEEDLDINTNNEIDLVQYKYYEKTKCRTSTFQGAIAYLFCHWKTEKEKSTNKSSYKYILFVYTQSKLQYTAKEIERILNLKAASTIIQNRFPNTKVTSNDVSEFLKVFNYVQAQSYEEKMQQLSEVVQQTLSVNQAQAEYIYIPFMMDTIHKIAVRNKKSDRQITIKSFIENIRKLDLVLNRSFIETNVNDNKLARTILGTVKNKYNSNIRNYQYILAFGNRWSMDELYELIIELVPKFLGPKRRLTNQAITFACDLTREQLDSLKIRLLTNQKLISSNVLLMNDGFESIKFNTDLFIKNEVRELAHNGTLVERSSFTYRLASYKHVMPVVKKFEDPFVFLFDCQNVNETKYENVLRFNGFSRDFVGMLVGGLSK